MKLIIGDVAAIRGDLRLRVDGSCMYAADQLIFGKYVKHAYNESIWLGVVDSIKDGMALVGGGWRVVDRYEVMACGTSRS